jgi:hypothetical protein
MKLHLPRALNGRTGKAGTASRSASQATPWGRIVQERTT